MSNALLSSKVTVGEEQPAVRTIDAVQTSIVAAVGVTERGPLGVPTLVTSFDEYKDIFGGFTADADMAIAAEGFFENEGQFFYVVRVVHYTDPAVPGSATSVVGTLTLNTAVTGPTAGSQTGSVVEPFLLVTGDDLDIDVDGAGPVTATFTGTPGIAIGTNTETFVLSDGLTLQFQVDGGPLQTVTFNTAEFVAIGAATALEVAAVINAEATGISADVSAGAVRITTDAAGSGAGLTGFAGTAAVLLGFSASAAGAGNVVEITAVTAAEVKTFVELAIAALTINSVGGAIQVVSNTTGVLSTILVEAASTADAKLGLDNATHTGTTGAAVPTMTVAGKTPGAYANTLTILIEAATSGDATEFNLTVLDDGLVVKLYPNLSMIDTATRFIETVMNSGDEASNLVTITDLDAVVDQRPALGTFGPLISGDDGLSGLVDADFIGDATGATGIRSLDTIQDITILLVPAQATSAIQNAMVTYCENTRNNSIFPILDPPAGMSATQIITYFETTAGLLGLSEFGAAYWPRVEISNPNATVFGDVARIVVAPSGILAGIYARTDAARPGGIYDPPAGIEKGVMLGVLGFETDETLDENKRDLVFPKRINILTTFTGAPRHVDGSRCLKGNGNFPFVAQRRGAIFIEQSIKNGVEFARNQNNTPKLRRTVMRSIRGFLLTQMKNEAFASQDPDTAFFVDFSAKLNPPSEVNAGRMNGRVGLAFNTPAEWIVIRFSRDTRALDQEIAG